MGSFDRPHFAPRGASRGVGGFRRNNDRGNDRGGRSSFGDRGNRPLFDAVCSNCGKPCQVPFRPTNGKPVYCSDCFEKMPHFDKSSRGEGNSRSDFRPQAPGLDQNKAQFDALNAKLDKILNLLQPKVAEPVSEPKTEKIAEKIDLTKVKKAVKKASIKK